MHIDWRVGEGKQVRVLMVISSRALELKSPQGPGMIGKEEQDRCHRTYIYYLHERWGLGLQENTHPI